MPKDFEIGRIAPFDNAFNIVQDADLPTVPRAVYVGGTGDLRVRMAMGAEVTFTDVQAGEIYPLRIIHVLSGATTATGLIGLT